MTRHRQALTAVWRSPARPGLGHFPACDVAVRGFLAVVSDGFGQFS